MRGVAWLPEVHLTATMAAACCHFRWLGHCSLLHHPELWHLHWSRVAPVSPVDFCVGSSEGSLP